MKSRLIGIGDAAVSADSQEELVTYALGSCVGVVIHDPVARVGGLLHLQMPDSRIDAAEARNQPFKYADTGIPELFHRAYALGADKARLRVYLLGGAQLLDPQGVFGIGQRNVLASRKILFRAGVFIHGEATGGTTSRTVRLQVQSGRVWLRVPGLDEVRFDSPAGPEEGERP